MYIIGASEERTPRRVLLHGALASSAQLTALGTLLGGDVVTPDLPGHGASAAATYDLDAFVDTTRAALGDGGDLVGYSLGGYVALATALAHPGLVRRVVTIATKLAWTPEVAAVQTARLDVDRLRAKAPDFVASLAAEHPAAGAEAVLAGTAAFMTGLGHSPRLPLADITCPVLVVVGDSDPLVTREECDEAVAALPHGRLAVLPDTGHVYERMPVELLASVVGPFLAETVTPPA